MYVTPNVQLVHVGAYLNPDAEPAHTRSAQNQRRVQRARLRPHLAAAGPVSRAPGPGGQRGSAALKLSTDGGAS